MPAAALILAAVHLGSLALLGLSPSPLADFPRFAFAVVVAGAAWIAFSASYLMREAAPGRRLLVVAAATAIGGRLLLLVPEAPLSDDLYRYLWDGRVANAGINPYIHAPSSAALDFLRDERTALVNHPDVPTIYPPVAQFAFRALDAAGAGPRGVRAAAAALDLASVAVFAAALRARGRAARLALVPALCPLVILETAGGGHVDVLGVFLLAIALLVFDRRPFVAGFFLGGATLVKLVPAALGPSFLSRAGGRAPVEAAPATAPPREVSPRAALLLLAGGVASLVITLPFVSAGPRLFDGLLAYSEHWRFHDALYTPLARAGVDPLVARRVLAVAFAIVAFLVARTSRELWSACGLVFFAFLVFSPTVHPWYALWLAPFAAFLPRGLRPAAFALLTLLPLSYAAAWTELNTGTWSEPAWSRPLLWNSVAALALIGLAREMVRPRSSRSAESLPRKL